MKEMGLSYEAAITFPAGLAYQLQHCHCRSVDKVCYYVTGRDVKATDFNHLFEDSTNIDTFQSKDEDYL